MIENDLFQPQILLNFLLQIIHVTSGTNFEVYRLFLTSSMHFFSITPKFDNILCVKLLWITHFHEQMMTFNRAIFDLQLREY